MDPPANVDEVKPEKLEEEKEAGPMYHCDLYDSEVVHKIAEALLPGLASACVDNTTGALMKNAGAVAVDIRKEMVDYLTNRSESFVAELMVLNGDQDSEVSNHPFDIISDFVDNFVSSKKNIWSKVSTWILSDRREDRIDDFVQEMEIDGFWLIARREAVSKTLVKNVDYKNEYHCSLKFKTQEELDEHMENCNFKTINCDNEGCNARFSAGQQKQHDSICPFKAIPCEQHCPEILLRHEMDKHCITVCSMKLVNCPFYQIGCKSTIPQCKTDEHRSEGLQDHLVCVLQGLHKEATTNDLKKRAEQVLELTSSERLAGIRDARSLANNVKNLDSKLGPLEITKPEPEPEPSKEEKEGRSSSSSESDKEKVDKKETSASPSTTSTRALDANHEPSEETKLKPSEEATEPVDKKERSASPGKPKEEERKSDDRKERSDSPKPSEEGRGSDDGKERSDSPKKPSEGNRESDDEKERAASPKKLSEENPEPVEKKERSPSPEPVTAAIDTRSSSDSDEDRDAKLKDTGATETEPKPSEEDGESADRKETSSPDAHDENQESVVKHDRSASSSSSEEGMESPSKKREVSQSTTEEHEHEGA